MFSFLFGFVIFVFSTCFLASGVIDLFQKIESITNTDCSEFFSEKNRHSFIFVLIGLIGYCVLFLGAAI